MSDTSPLAASDFLSPDTHDVKLRAAWLYHVEQLTQEEVARQLGLNRSKVLRLLAAAREEGLVQISINGRGSDMLRLEQALTARFGLQQAIVVPVSGLSEALAIQAVAHATGRYLSEQINDGISIGVGWGATLHHAIRSLAWRHIRDATVVSLLGEVTHAGADSPSAVAWQLAHFYRTELYQITAPVFVPSPELAQALWQIDEMAKLQARAQALDLVLLSVGDLSRQASIFRRGLLAWDTADSLKAAGAVGDVLCHFVDAAGQIVDHPANQRVMAIHPASLAAVPRIVISSCGARKAQAIIAGIAATRAHTLITDETAARAMLRLAGTA
ncbi:sugar-binding transcriptional regulator [Kerstersia sp.]|uniref:sugar-binding transcriptional regulator n=1 Tax=Kerstersia sp. TaxID=1930783 RepID=UPI003F8E4DCA